MSPSEDDKRRFEALVERHQRAVCAIAYAVLGDRARSEEVAQDAFVVAWHKRDDIAITPAWLCAVARNLARNAARRRTEVIVGELPDVTTRDPRDEMVSRDDAAHAVAALAKLPEQYREAVVLHCRGDSMAEVADALGITEATAKQRVHRGRERLRDALQAVDATLRATGPSAGFTAATVGVWLARGGVADAATLAAAGDATATAAASGTAKPVAAAGTATKMIGAFAVFGVLVAAVVVGIAAGGSRADSAITVPRAGDAGVTTGRRARIAARFPVAKTRPAAPAGFVTVDDTAAPATFDPSKTVDVDFVQVPTAAMMDMLADVIQAPIMVEDGVGERVDITAKNEPAIDVLDEIVAKIGARRDEVEAIRLVDDGSTDASTLGGDPMSLDVANMPLHDVVALIEHPLHMPISRMALSPEWFHPAPDEIGPLVTIAVTDVPAGEVLEQVLEQVGLGYEMTTGFVVSALPAD